MGDFFRAKGGDCDGRPGDYRPDPSLDEIFRLLANHRRRCLLQLLRDRDTPRFWLHNLAIELSEFESELQSIDAQPPHEIEFELHHTHLPALANAGIVEYDRERATGRYLGDPATESLLAWEQSYSDTDHKS